mgnify:CR=1 FL=1
MSILRLSLVLLQFIFMVVGMVYLIFSKDLPKIETITEIKLTNPMRIYSADNQLIGLFGTEKRQIVSYEDIPENLKNAIIAAEDGGFFDHSGVEITSLLRAAYGEISGRSLGGGGTITMQVVRGYLLTREQTITRKIKEIFLALELEGKKTKEEIFELYVNRIFLGNRSYGIQAASNTYFNKELNELCISFSEPASFGFIDLNINEETAICAHVRDLKRGLSVASINHHVVQKEEGFSLMHSTFWLGMNTKFINPLTRKIRHIKKTI